MPISYEDGRTRSINVSFWWEGRYRRCGKIHFNSVKRRGFFEYDPIYQGPPLDPINLNYLRDVRRLFEVDPFHGGDLLHRVFVDYLPGPWGLSVLEGEFPELAKMRAVEKMHWFGNRTVGSLSFHVEHPKDEKPINGIDRLEEIRRRSVAMFTGKLPRFGDLSEAPGHGNAPRWVLDGLSAFGGARPKCLFEDREGGQWLAKFNADTDSYNFARMERAVAKMAAGCGINAVETRAHAMTEDNDVLFVRRFDRHAKERWHKVSAFSLMRADIVKHHSQGDYAMLFELLEQVCCDAQTEKAELMRRMLFNIAVNNVDDHLKNFELLLDHDAHCYRLSPSFDVTVDPYPYPRMTSVFGMKQPDLGPASMQSICEGLQRFGIGQDNVMQARANILMKVSQWKVMMAACGVSAHDIIRLQAAFKGAEQQARALPNYQEETTLLYECRTSLRVGF